jgi:extradiol dioxygenase family protein
MRPEQVGPPDANDVRHFGAILPWGDWEALCAALATFEYPLMTQPKVLGQGTQAEHGKVLLRDPSGHMLEFKTYRHIGTVLPDNGPNQSCTDSPVKR